ncbi:hypothetical protein [Bifidobacterium sp. SO1]|uniref:hypothetical protein n=1 Tax=Bifidobacterium sp. SO1 TaxID=2809029 RepID=UPI001BDC2606|nr:hypothetical protein [Bifidobacterium sp. SO1]MBT1161797.1 hypothetical protein [Bifidobacterium sp. SO1]
MNQRRDQQNVPGAVTFGVTVLPTPTSRDGKGANQRHDPSCMPVAVENLRLFSTPNCMDTLPARHGAAYEKALHRGGEESRRATSGNLREETDHMTDTRMITGSPDTLWGLDDGIGVDFGRFTQAVRRWERVFRRPAPCPTQVTGGLRKWVARHADDPTLFDPYWLARHASHEDGGTRLDDPERKRVWQRFIAADRGRSLIDPVFWPGSMAWDEDLPIPATRLPAKCVTDYWKARTRHEGRFPSLTHLSPRFVEWMMGLPDKWVTDPNIWRNVSGSHRNLQLRALGNGVVPQQAATAIDWSLTVRERLSA